MTAGREKGVLVGNDYSLQTRFVPMLMPQKRSDYGICVEYSRANGFRAYQLWSHAGRPAEEDVWEAYLGVPLMHRELEVFQSRLAQFPPEERDSFEIT